MVAEKKFPNKNAETLTPRTAQPASRDSVWDPRRSRLCVTARNRRQTLQISEKTYLFRVPYDGFYIQSLKKVGLFGYRYR